MLGRFESEFESESWLCFFLIADSHGVPNNQEHRALIEALLQEKCTDSNGVNSPPPKYEQSQHIDSKIPKEPPNSSPIQKAEFAEVNEYNALIHKMLDEIDSCKSKLEKSRCLRIRKGVLGVHTALPVPIADEIYEPKPNGDLSQSASQDQGLYLSTSVESPTYRWVFVTANGSDFHPVNIPDNPPVETLRTMICQCVGVSDWTSAQIFLAEPGQPEHREPMSDTNLVYHCLAESGTSLKLIVRRPSSNLPRFDSITAHPPSICSAAPISPRTAHRVSYVEMSHTGSIQGSSEFQSSPAFSSFSHEPKLHNIEQKQKEQHLTDKKMAYDETDYKPTVIKTNPAHRLRRPNQRLLPKPPLQSKD